MAKAPVAKPHSLLKEPQECSVHIGDDIIQVLDWGWDRQGSVGIPQPEGAVRGLRKRICSVGMDLWRQGHEVMGRKGRRVTGSEERKGTAAGG